MSANITDRPLTLQDWEPYATERAELLHGFEYTLRCQSTTAAHAETAFRTASLLDRAVHQAGLPCVVRTEGPLVDINGHTAHIPDVSVECCREDDIADTHIKPCIVVEVMSPGTRNYDMTTKLTSYMQFLSYITDYLLIDTETHTVIHYQRTDGDVVDMAVFTSGDIVALQIRHEVLQIQVDAIFNITQPTDDQ